jgi:hypothetical protein
LPPVGAGGWEEATPAAGVAVGKLMQIGIAAYLRNLAVCCNKIARNCSDARAHDALAAISAELADKAEALESTFKVPKKQN